MQGNYNTILTERLDAKNLSRLMALPNPKLHEFIAEAIELCNPAAVFVCTDSAEDIARIRRRAVELGEEKPLIMPGHTVHFDGYFDQGRDKEVTRYLIPPGLDLGANLNSIGREEGLAEIKGLLKNSMASREMIVRFFCLGPTNSAFSISGVQLTDSAYVAHSEDLLYRPGYEQFKRLGGSADFFRVLHSAGEFENFVSKNYDKKRIYIDITQDTVYSVNTQYAGNTVGFKKLSLRLAIRKADREGWLAEHMFVMGAHGPGGRVTYLIGAFPSFCGKTSTAMLPGETIIGDDIAYLRSIDGVTRAVNVENGIFGIVKSVNPTDDPVIHDVLTKQGEVIFSNVLVKNGMPYWEGMGRELPADGINHSGQWFRGKKDAQGNVIDPSHKNSRYTVRLSALQNLDPKADDTDGVEVAAVVYGGRDSDTCVPVLQAFDWAHGVITLGASLESETTAATLGKQGVVGFQPMSNLDFVSIPLGRYVMNHLNFAQNLKRTPLIFGVNYFLRGKDGEYLNSMLDKRVWVKWIELRTHNDADALPTPTGMIPIYDDLKALFKQVLNRGYTREQYETQFTTRIPENLRKIERIAKIYREQVPDTPKALFDVLDQQQERLLAAQILHGDYVSPYAIAERIK